MAQKRKRNSSTRFFYTPEKSLLGLLLALVILMMTAFHYAQGKPNLEAQIVLAKENPNFHVKTIATQFFEDNDAHEMVSIIRCESAFRQFENDGSPLKNREGSSAIGAAQILASKHPDPKIIARYNRRFDMDMEVEDFDITTLEGNLGYALVLYKIRGTRDWECGKKFAF